MPVLKSERATHIAGLAVLAAVLTMLALQTLRLFDLVEITGWPKQALTVSNLFLVGWLTYLSLRRARLRKSRTGAPPPRSR